MKQPLVEIRDVDRQVYERELKDFLPDQIIDVHTHIWLKEFALPPDPDSVERTVKWPDKVATEGPIEDLRETYRLFFPGKKVTPIFFTMVLGDLEKGNAYCARAARAGNGHALLFSRPEWSAAELEEKITAGGFLGVKSYLTTVPSYLPTAEIRIYDFFPPHQLEVLDAHGWIMMLHIPRNGRLKDPVNLAQMMEIDRRYPNLRTIIAHVGRAYCPEDVGAAFDVLRKSRHLLFDFSANTNAMVFEQLIRAVGPKRILFGSDLPIVRMRMRRICEQGMYVNLVPRGLYGEIGDDPHMREVSDAEAAQLTFFLYEELRAFRRAAEACALTRADLEDVFQRNAQRMIDGAGRK